MKQPSLNPPQGRLREIVDFLETHPAVLEKSRIHHSYRQAPPLPEGWLPIGDDCSAIPDEQGGYLLLAAEGMLENFVREDPWFAGYSAVMVNVSDVCSMGGRPLAVVDVLWKGGPESTRAVWDGMVAAAGHYGVPITGGHTGPAGSPDSAHLAVAILGRARRLMRSDAARPRDRLLMAVDLQGSFRREKPFWNASSESNHDDLAEKIAILPRVAEREWCRACKDISNGGVIGTLMMMLESSNAGAQIHLGQLPKPSGVELDRWLISFPSFGYLLAVPAESVAAVDREFSSKGIACSEIGRITAAPDLELCLGDDCATLFAQDSSAQSRRGRKTSPHLGANNARS